MKKDYKSYRAKKKRHIALTIISNCRKFSSILYGEEKGERD